MIALVVAMDEQRGIGVNNQLPWRLSADMAYFKTLTTETKDKTKQNAVVMGRLTWESLPERFRPLPNRHNIVISRDSSYPLPDGVSLISDLGNFEARIETLRKEKELETIYIIGGAQIYAWALDQSWAKRLYVTSVQASFACDAFFPEFEQRFTCIDHSPSEEEKGVAFSFKTFERSV